METPQKRNPLPVFLNQGSPLCAPSRPKTLNLLAVVLLKSDTIGHRVPNLETPQHSSYSSYLQPLTFQKCYCRFTK